MKGGSRKNRNWEMLGNNEYGDCSLNEGRFPKEPQLAMILALPFRTEPQ